MLSAQVTIEAMKRDCSGKGKNLKGGEHGSTR